MTLLRSADLRARWEATDPPERRGSVATTGTGASAAGGEILLGRDARRSYHLLVPVPSGSVPTDTGSRRVLLVRQPLELDGTERVYADLVCVDPSLVNPFAELCVDVVTRVPTLEKDHGAGAAIALVLDEWRELFRSARSMDRVSLVGVVGELQLLESLAGRSPERALEAWSGPAGGVHDFQAPGIAVEVKTSTAHEGTFVQIHGPDQLDPPPGTDLFLHYVRVREEESAPTLADRVDRLVGMGVPRSGLRRKLAALGLESGGGWEEQRFRVVEEMTWAIDTDFPGVRRSRLEPGALAGVDQLTYRIDLAAGGAPLPRDDGLNRVVERLVGHE